MSNFDLNTINGLQQVVGGTASLLQSFLGRDPKLWDLSEGAYNGVRFHVLTNADYSAALPKISETGGKRIVKYLFPYRDGQTTDNLGVAPKRYEVEALIFGENYKSALVDLIKELEKNSVGILTHPVMGNVKVVVETYQTTHQSEQRKAAALRIVFEEHTFTVVSISKQDLSATPPNSIKSALMNGLKALQDVGSVLTKIQAASFSATSFKNQIKNLINDYSSFFSGYLQKMNVTFNAGTSSDIPSLLPVNNGGNAISAGNLASNNYPIAYVPSDPYSTIGIDTANTISIAPLTPQQAGDTLNTLVAKLDVIVQALENDVGLSGGEISSGSLFYYSEIMTMRETGVSAQRVLDVALASSLFTVIDYTTPRLMSIREVAFETGLTVDEYDKIINLNPSLQSVNYIEKGTKLTVPKAS